MSYKVLARFKVTQFSSVIVVPIEIPRICVWTAPATPTVQRSELPPEIICGEIADGGGDSTFVFIEPFVVTVLVVVDSVTIGSWALAFSAVIIKSKDSILSVCNNFIEVSYIHP